MRNVAKIVVLKFPHHRRLRAKPWENNIGDGWSHSLNVHLRTSSGTMPTTVVYWNSSGAYRTYTYSATAGGYDLNILNI